MFTVLAWLDITIEHHNVLLCTALTKPLSVAAGPFSLVAPAAIMLGIYAGQLHPGLEMALLCCATGTFLYIGASEVMTEEFEAHADKLDSISEAANRYLKFTAVMLGVVSMAAVSFLQEP